MGTLNKRTRDLTGQQIDGWYVIRFYDYVLGNAFWWCQCSCGLQKSVKAQDLLGGTSRRCKDCAKLPRANDDKIPNNCWTTMTYNATKRGIDMPLTREEYYQILVDQQFRCALSGVELYMSKNTSEQIERKTTASLDRIDNSKPYTRDNVQWIHKDINTMKNVFTQSYLIEWCRKIIDHDDQQLQKFVCS